MAGAGGRREGCGHQARWHLGPVLEPARLGGGPGLGTPGSLPPFSCLSDVAHTPAHRPGLFCRLNRVLHREQLAHGRGLEPERRDQGTDGLSSFGEGGWGHRTGPGVCTAEPGLRLADSQFKAFCTAFPAFSPSAFSSPATQPVPASAPPTRLRALPGLRPSCRTRAPGLAGAFHQPAREGTSARNVPFA